MEAEVVEIYTDEITDKIAGRFGTKKKGLKLLGDAENFVYEYPCDGQRRILRVTHSSHRTENQIRGEIDWLNYLADNDVPAARAYDSPRGNLVERVEAADGSYFLVVSFEMAPGRILGPGEWTPELITEWGRIVGMTHRLTLDYPDPGEGLRREHWHQFDYLNVRKYLPENDEKIIEKTEGLVARLKKLPIDGKTYGLVHTDVHHYNLLVDGDQITLIDFDDAHHTWFAGDIATILFYLPPLAQKPENLADFTRFWLANFQKGYEQEYRLEDWWKETYHDFLKLREMVTYVWINKKLDMDNLDERQQQIVDRYRSNIEGDVPLVDIDFTRI